MLPKRISNLDFDLIRSARATAEGLRSLSLAAERLTTRGEPSKRIVEEIKIETWIAAQDVDAFIERFIELLNTLEAVDPRES